jgi:hypothetical protein
MDPATRKVRRGLSRSCHQRHDTESKRGSVTELLSLEQLMPHATMTARTACFDRVSSLSCCKRQARGGHVAKDARDCSACGVFACQGDKRNVTARANVGELNSKRHLMQWSMLSALGGALVGPVRASGLVLFPAERLQNSYVLVRLRYLQDLFYSTSSSRSA